MSFFDPLSKKSGIKFQKHRNKELLGTEITDKTIGENIQKQLDYWVYNLNSKVPVNDLVDVTLRDEISDRANTQSGLEGKGNMMEIVFNSVLLYSGFYPMMAVYCSLMGVHYDNTIKTYNMEEGAKGVLDLLVFPLIARKLLTDCREFIGNKNNYQSELSYDLIVKVGSWVLLPAKFGIGLALEIVRHALPMALLAVYLGVVAVTSLALLTLSIPVSITFAVGCGIYDIGANVINGLADACEGFCGAYEGLKDSCTMDLKPW